MCQGRASRNALGAAVWVTLQHALICLGILMLPVAVAAQGNRDTVFIVPGAHLDLGFTAPISEVREQRIHILDRAIQMALHDSSFVWFEEGGWSVDAWLD